ncbi:hypothetical protein ACVWXM_009632 [Bradyrhizobium sp. GM7.3]
MTATRRWHHCCPVDGSRALLNATDEIWWVERILTLQDFLTDYNVSLRV